MLTISETITVTDTPVITPPVTITVTEVVTVSDAVVPFPDNIAPIAVAGAAQVVEATSAAGATVTLESSASSDADGDELSFVWQWSGGSAAGSSPVISLPLGAHVISLTVRDGRGGIAQATTTVTVRDTSPPVVFAAVPNRSTLWPPTGDLVRVRVDVTASDLGDGKAGMPNRVGREQRTRDRNRERRHGPGLVDHQRTLGSAASHTRRYERGARLRDHD